MQSGATAGTSRFLAAPSRPRFTGSPVRSRFRAGRSDPWTARLAPGCRQSRRGKPWKGTARLRMPAQRQLLRLPAFTYWPTTKNTTGRRENVPADGNTLTTNGRTANAPSVIFPAPTTKSARTACAKPAAHSSRCWVTTANITSIWPMLLQNRPLIV